MKVQNINSNISYSSLNYGYTLSRLKKENMQPLILSEIEESIYRQNLHKKKYVDLILDTDIFDHSHVEALIVSKKQGIPMNPDATFHFGHKVSSNIIEKFQKWVNSWNFAYSPKRLKAYEELQKTANKILV